MEKTDKHRRPPLPPTESLPSGRAVIDERGNSVWQWREGDDQAAATVESPGLSLEEAKAQRAAIQPNEAATRLGYDPYNSGVIPPSRKRKPRDLRALSKEVQRGKPLRK